MQKSIPESLREVILFFPSNDGHLYALDSLTGQPLWQHEIGTWVASSPAISGNTLVVGALDGNLYAYTSSGKAEDTETASTEQ